VEEKIKDLKSAVNPVGNGLHETDQPDFQANPLYPAFSEAVKIEYTNERGRYGVASRAIEVFGNSFLKSFN
jgi:hypothetical protein